MGNFSKDRLRLVAQGVTKGRLWYYDDTGAIGTIADTTGFFSVAGDMGIDTGDLVFIQAKDGTANRQVHAAAFIATQDTGTTQGTVGPQTLVGDTG